MDDKKKTVAAPNSTVQTLALSLRLLDSVGFTSISELHITAISISHQQPHMVIIFSAVYHAGYACAHTSLRHMPQGCKLGLLK